jgi:large conductance mechanosensitive channel protein
MWKEFKEFAVKGNVVDLAVAVIIGGAFGKIVSSLVADLVMPLIGLLIGGINFTALQISIGKDAIRYGLFLQNVVDFFIIAFALFLVIKALNHRKKAEVIAVESPQPTNQEILLAEIRDLLREKR